MLNRFIISITGSKRAVSWLLSCYQERFSIFLKNGEFLMQDRLYCLGNWVPSKEERMEEEEKFWSSKLHNPLERSFLTVGHLSLPGAEVIRAIYSGNSSRSLTNLIISSLCPRIVHMCHIFISNRRNSYPSCNIGICFSIVSSFIRNDAKFSRKDTSLLF